MIIFADRQAHNQTDTNSKTEAHSYPLLIVGERANSKRYTCLESQPKYNGKISDILISYLSIEMQT